MQLTFFLCQGVAHLPFQDHFYFGRGVAHLLTFFAAGVAHLFKTNK